MLRDSKWQFVTSAGGGVSLALSATGGKIVLTDPAGRNVNFYYGGVGGGPSVGVKLPKIGRLKKTGSGGNTAFPSTGRIYCLPGCRGADLTEADFQGVCVFAEGAGGLIVGVSGDVMFLGGNPAWLLTLPAGGGMSVDVFLKSCNALLLMAGVNAGLQAGAGLSGYLGYLR
jgi:hypothetical protein